MVLSMVVGLKVWGRHQAASTGLAAKMNEPSGEGVPNRLCRDIPFFF